MSQMSVVSVHDPGTRAAPSMPPATGLRFLQPVPRELVHRSAVAEVFVTDGVREGDGRFAVAAQWPRDHALYHPDAAGHSDPLLFAETVRQTLLYLGHAHFGIPAGHRFVGRDLAFHLTDLAALRVRGAPLPVVLETDWAVEDGQLPHRAAVRLEVRLLVDGAPCGHATLRSLVMDDRRYRLLRGRTAPDPVDPDAVVEPAVLVPPHRVGRLRWKDCVLERAADGWRLGLDPDHAVLFDHPTDHVPLMVLLEGFRQLGHLALHERPGGPAFALAGAATECLSFGELDRPVRLLLAQEDTTGAAPGAVRTLHVSAVQDERLLARAVTTWVPAGPARPPRPQR